MVAEVRYDNIYAFKYSPRPFTKAARWEDKTPDEEKSERLERLFALQRPISAENAVLCMDQSFEVLVEEVNDGRAYGRTSSNRPRTESSESPTSSSECLFTAATTGGAATALAKGTTLISASLPGVSGATDLQVTGGDLLSFTVSPATPVLVKGTVASAYVLPPMAW